MSGARGSASFDGSRNGATGRGINLVAFDHDAGRIRDRTPNCVNLKVGAVGILRRAQMEHSADAASNGKINRRTGRDVDGVASCRASPAGFNVNETTIARIVELLGCDAEFRIGGQGHAFVGVEIDGASCNPRGIEPIVHRDSTLFGIKREGGKARLANGGSNRTIDGHGTRENIEGKTLKTTGHQWRG